MSKGAYPSHWVRMWDSSVVFARFVAFLVNHVMQREARVRDTSFRRAGRTRAVAAAGLLTFAACADPERPVGLVWDALHAHHPGERVARTDSVEIMGGRRTVQVEGHIALVGYCPDVLAEAERNGSVIQLNVHVRRADRSSVRACDDMHTVNGVWYSAGIEDLSRGSYTLRVRHSVAAPGSESRKSRVLPDVRVRVR